MSAAVSSPTAPATRPRRRKWPLVLMFAVGLLGGGYAYLTISARWELQEAAAETDRLDPRWRLEDVESGRADISEASNAALVTMAVKPLLPAKWPAWETMTGDRRADVLQLAFTSLESQRQLGKEQIDALRAELERASLALPKARKLADMPEGRYPITYSADFLGTLLPYAQNARAVAHLLVYDAMLRSQEGDDAAALTSCRAVLNTARSFGDEPFVVSQLVRIACRQKALHALERTLAQGQPAETALRDVQQLVEREETEPLLLFGLRGERGGFDRYLAHIAAAQGFLSRRSIVLATLGGGPRDLQSTLTERLALHSSTNIERQRAALLRILTRAVEIAKSPPEQQQEEMDCLEATIEEQPLLVRLLVPALTKTSAACRRSHMQLRCAFVALAAERYRLIRKKWPDRLEALHAAGYLPEVPADLYDGQPLRLRRLEDGLLIYSVGPDAQDNGGHIEHSKPFSNGTDMGFRLWDADKRRQKAAPLEPVDVPAAAPPGFAPPPHSTSEDRNK